MYIHTSGPACLAYYSVEYCRVDPAHSEVVHPVAPGMKYIQTIYNTHGTEDSGGCPHLLISEFISMVFGVGTGITFNDVVIPEALL